MVELQVLHALDNIRQYTVRSFFVLFAFSIGVCFMPKIAFIVAVVIKRRNTIKSNSPPLEGGPVDLVCLYRTLGA